MKTKLILAALLLMATMTGMAATKKKKQRKSTPKTEVAAPITIPDVLLTAFAPLSYGIAKSEKQHDILTGEQLGLDNGVVIYRKQVPAIEQDCVLELQGPCDFLQVFLDQQLFATLRATNDNSRFELPSLSKGGVLTLMGDVKEPVVIHTEMDGNEVSISLKNWNTITIPDNYATASLAHNKWLTMPLQNTLLAFTRAGYYRGTFKLKRVGDARLNVKAFGRGQVFVNGQSVGRFDNQGQQTSLTVPASCLKKGDNEVIVLDIIGPVGDPVVTGE